MFLLLALLSPVDELTRRLSQNVSSRNKVIQELQCEDHLPISRDIISADLQPGKKVCVRSMGTIFINGTDITITGYTDGKKNEWKRRCCYSWLF